MTQSPRATLLAILAVLAMTFSLSPAAGAVLSGSAPLADDSVDNGSDLPDTRQSGNLELVANIDMPGGGGTDIEFFSRTLDAWEVDSDGDQFSDTTVSDQGSMERHFAVVGNQSTGAWITDITDPEAPFVTDIMSNCRVGQGDIQTAKDGSFMLIASQGGSCTLADGRTVTRGSIVVDLADPYNPTPVSIASGTAHNNTLHPSGDYIYISSSALAAVGFSTIPIYKVNDDLSVEHVNTFSVPANGPHDIRFNQDGSRAYTAGVSTFQVFDTTDPENPELISTIVPPGGSIGHDTLITRDSRFLFLGDEGGGGGAYPCPGGALYVYDMLVEESPVYLGQVYAGGGPVTGRTVDALETGGVVSCTSHVMELDPSGQSLTLGWYGLGFRIFNFSSFYNADGSAKTAGAIAAAWGKYGAGMVETHYMIPDGGSTWAAKQYAPVPGYVFADDINVGLYVAKLVD